MVSRSRLRLVNRPLLPAVDHSSIWAEADRDFVDRVSCVGGVLRHLAWKAAVRAADGDGQLPHPALMSTAEVTEAQARWRRMGLSIRALTWSP